MNEQQKQRIVELGAECERFAGLASAGATLIPGLPGFGGASENRPHAERASAEAFRIAQSAVQA